ncbi:MAG: universal stress protein UspA [Deltaproteobacteria bacterium RIFCSPLOWO2_01_44_7]|nr:MAG: universal stress protein UspA [Deltaproteobacteria bacterium RIFCSPHIGHO2_01_FULL_43_49]OGQ15784.1 MAG: universal stress protein UspA [Deltaproteobacteria bacterium RIFCSPHIGHO2_02_FULL_44_53]OGQ28740.1 MAG: universal stress protein UspA [Deltaproteobacteria bacterium RIFCSPHIGHO2_12_FULL_44_21]OGQ32035.1 MAG: universal stress protein UspA [Deltaproteobacteria bacterium RIFCSPLOWO2_01_FULL_45_74]OGQ39570.1 MAG: universal stress protein UspA [Deltaproteobacteria bacterium RIFCSPLOWO2_01_
MYKRILVTLDHSAADDAILHHIESLNPFIKSEVVLLHVADGWAARYHDELQLKDSEEVRQDRAYLEAVAKRLQKKGIKTTHFLAMGDPADEIIKFAKEHQCDLIAMSTHGHRFLSDLIHGATATKVRHQVDIPVLLLKAPKV